MRNQAGGKAGPQKGSLVGAQFISYIFILLTAK